SADHLEISGKMKVAPAPVICALTLSSAAVLRVVSSLPPEQAARPSARDRERTAMRIGVLFIGVLRKEKGAAGAGRVHEMMFLLRADGRREKKRAPCGARRTWEMERCAACARTLKRTEMTHGLQTCDTNRLTSASGRVPRRPTGRRGSRRARCRWSTSS